ncbi:MAG TPA: glycosyltransferase family 9 protein, partial [Burkholderiaceae bacterium]
STRIDTIPCGTAYLQAESAKTEFWKKRLRRSGNVRVGLAWAGNKTMRKDYLRSLPLQAMAPLLETVGIHFISLQSGGSAEIAASGLSITDWMQEAPDYADTAALIANLDLVISVDTAVAHLAGALGVPVWLLNRFESEWRWLAEGDHSPWYPHTRIFRQPALHDWHTVIAQVKQELRLLVEQEALRQRRESTGLLNKLIRILKIGRSEPST